jgi:arabinose-5-phosphate isomerase
MASALDIARHVVADEARALGQLAESLDERFDAVLGTVLTATQTIVSGLGKSGNIAKKIAASLTSTGTPAVYMHPVEALHGDLGIVSERHCLIALSCSGNTEELLRFVVHFRRLGGPVIGITQRADSRLAELSKHVILLPDVPEAGPLNLAPTTSSVMMLAAGDALAMALLHQRGFGPEDFAQYHPEGTLGRRLLLRAGDLMHAGEQLPLVPAGASFQDLILEMTRKQLGLAMIVRPDGSLLGTFTDGDLRRVFERVAEPRTLDAETAHAKSRRPSASPPVPISTIQPAHPAIDCLRIMRDSQITSLVVTDTAGRPIGLLRLLDLLKAGLS